MVSPETPTANDVGVGLIAAADWPASVDSTKVSVTPGLTVKDVPLTREPGLRGLADEAGVEVRPIVPYDILLIRSSSFWACCEATATRWAASADRLEPLYTFSVAPIPTAIKVTASRTSIRVKPSSARASRRISRYRSLRCAARSPRRG